jgi:uncharacterized membrane protein
MDYGWALLRVLHVLCGTIWVGSDFLLSFVVFPRVRALGLDVERAVLGELARYLPPVMLTASLVTLATGVWMTGSMQGWNLNWMFATSWGTSIAIGLIATAIAFIVGVALIPRVTIRYEKFMKATAGRTLAAEEVAEMGHLSASITRLARLNTALLLIVVIAMAMARV